MTKDQDIIQESPEEYKVGDTVWAKDPILRYKKHAGKVVKIEPAHVTIRRLSGKESRHIKTDVSKDFGKLNPNPYKTEGQIVSADRKVGKDGRLYPARREIVESFNVKNKSGKVVDTKYSEGEAKKRAEELQQQTKEKHTVEYNRKAVVKEDSLDELNISTVKSYKDKAGEEAKQAKKFTKSEYGDIAKRVLDRRTKGLKMANSRLEEANNSGSLSVNMKHMHKWKVDQDNVRYYDKIMASKGKVQSLDTRPYEDHLNHFNIFYTSTRSPAVKESSMEDLASGKGDGKELKSSPEYKRDRRRLAQVLAARKVRDDRVKRGYPEDDKDLDESLKSAIKNIKRGLSGWDNKAVGPGGETNDPKDIVRRVKDRDDASLIRLHKTIKKPLGFPFRNVDYDEKDKHTPAGLQKRAVDREMKKRGLDESKLAMPLKGHVYHTKSDAELKYIVKDAGETARIQKGMSSEGKYLDQMNDASTILHYRSKGGKQIIKNQNEATEGFTGNIEEVSTALLKSYAEKAREDARRLSKQGDRAKTVQTKYDKYVKATKRHLNARKAEDRIQTTNFTERNKMKTTKDLLSELTHLVDESNAKGFEAYKPNLARTRRAALQVAAKGATVMNKNGYVSASQVAAHIAKNGPATDITSVEKHLKSQYKPHKTEKKYYSVRNESNEELTQALDILEDLETEDEIADFLESLDEETLSEINEMLSEDQVDEGAILDIEAKIREHDKKRRPDMAAHEIVTHEKIRKNLMAQRTRAQRADGRAWAAEAAGGPALGSESFRGSEVDLRQAYNKKINNESTLERAIANYRSKTRLDEGDVSENAKWRQGYSASGHPAGFKHKNGEVGPLGGTFTNEPSGYDGETSKVPVQKYRDIPDPLDGRGEKLKISIHGRKLTQKFANRNLKDKIKKSLGTHGPVGKLPESTLEVAIANHREIYEGTWILTSKDGVKKRFKDDKSPEAKAWVAGNQKKVKIPTTKATKPPTVNLDTIWNKVEQVVSSIYPDGDPIDYLGPWCKKQGIDYSMVDKAAKKHGYKDIYDYWDKLSGDLNDNQDH